MITNKAAQAALIERLLESPLAAELERSLHNGTEAARRRIESAIEDLTRKHEARYPALAAKARELAEKRDALRAEYEAAKLTAMRALIAADNQRDYFHARRAELREVARAGAEHLQSLGLESAEAVEKRFGL